MPQWTNMPNRLRNHQSRASPKRGASLRDGRAVGGCASAARGSSGSAEEAEREERKVRRFIGLRLLCPRMASYRTIRRLAAVILLTTPGIAGDLARDAS